MKPPQSFHRFPHLSVSLHVWPHLPASFLLDIFVKLLYSRREYGKS